ncbi:MAG: hypothetical protein JRI77_09630 [Deltaproteobacteria bacterium]|nr:hypothetical protein [Deltaproteobacteria bacterium]
MFTPGVVHVYGLDRYGRKHLVGYSLPSAILEAITKALVGDKGRSGIQK